MAFRDTLETALEIMATLSCLLELGYGLEDFFVVEGHERAGDGIEEREATVLEVVTGVQLVTKVYEADHGVSFSIAAMRRSR